MGGHMKKILFLVSTVILNSAYAGVLSSKAQEINQLSQQVSNISERIEYGNARPVAEQRLHRKLTALIQEARSMKAMLDVDTGRGRGPHAPQIPSRPHVPSPPVMITCSQDNIITFQSTFTQIKNFAKAYNGLGKNTSSATSYAHSWTRNYPCSYAQEFIQNFQTILSFAKAYNGLGKNTSSARSYALSKANQLCVNYPLSSEFNQHLSFAKSYSGLNMNTTNARDYALNQVEHLAFSCQNI